jgi:hypothetical protein
MPLVYILQDQVVHDTTLLNVLLLLNICSPVAASCSPNQRQILASGLSVQLMFLVYLTISVRLVKISAKWRRKRADPSNQRRRHIPHPWHACMHQGSALNNRSVAETWGRSRGSQRQTGSRPRVRLELIRYPAPSDRSYSDAAINKMMERNFLS